MPLLSATSTQTATSTLPCDTNAFLSDLATSSSAVFWFQNKDKGNSQVFLTLLPARKIKEYDATRGKQISLTVRPLSSPVISQTPTPPASGIISLPPPPPVSPVAKSVFKIYLRRGSRGAEVSALQEFLKKDPVIYPEELVTGFFGPATERAVQRFQKKHGLVSSGSPATTGYGAVGPKTRTKLNSL